MAEASGTAGSDTGASGARPKVNQVSQQRFEHGRQLAGRIGICERSFTLSFKLRTTDQSISVAGLHKLFITKFIEKADGSVSFQSTSKVEGADKTSFTSAEEFPKQDRDHRRFFNRSIIRLKDGVHTLFRIDHKMIMSDSVSNVKEKLFPFLRSKNLYMINGDLIMSEHRKIAWLYGAHTSMISFSRHQDILNTMLVDCPGATDVINKYSNIKEGDTMPLLSIVPHTIRWGGPNDRVESEVAAITSVTGYSKMMKELLMLIPPESTPYEIIPEGFAQMTSADKYKELLKANNDEKNSVQGIAIVGMGKSDMDKKYTDDAGAEHKSIYHYLSITCPGVVTIKPTKYLESQGRWMCIVKRTSYENAKLFLTDFLGNKYLDLLGAADREINLGLFDTLPRIAESIPLGADMRTRVEAIDARYCQNRPPPTNQPAGNAWERPRRFVFNLDDAEEFPPMNANQPTNPSNATPNGNTTAPTQATAAAAAPTNRLHKREDRFDHRCPTCLHEHETDDHVFQCPHRDRQRWRSAFVAGIVRKLSSFLDPELLVLIRTGLQSYLTNRPEIVPIRFPPSPSICNKYGISTIEDPHCRLAKAQTAVGWDHFVRGKLVTDWTKLQFRYAARYGLLEKSKQWHTWLIRYMANNSFELWSQRNRHRHGADSSTRHDKALQQAKRDVRDLYKQRDQVLPRDQNIFSDNLDVHLEQPLPNLQEWLALNRRLIRFSV